MVFNTNINAITANTTLSTKDDVYLIDAAGGSITVTLPNITGDGMQYKMKRTDNTATSIVTLTGTGGQTIDGSTSITILPLSICEVQSYNSLWYLISNFSISRSNAKALFTAAFIQNNGTPNVTYAGSPGTAPFPDQNICSFFYAGTTTETIARVVFVLGSSSNTTYSGTAKITTQAGTTLASATFSFTNPPGATAATAFLSTTITVASLPSGSSVLEYRVNFGGNNNKLDVFSITVQ